ncbi:hypothetical protein [Chitinophaga pinensis]|uniref:Outer membrane protein beta-barrel domain-containing protein n=1 Tax=Chitinophaga pinensis TaxID=79329 RepID=A0A5C6LTX2_9BACT|nr:hypothetical protein [Chitinophaga pinensis]TWW00835.1 hypothetical protein FEF09_10100 [Chitinophaga pinensis]
MKKITWLALLVIGISSAHAQTRFGITAGFGHGTRLFPIMIRIEHPLTRPKKLLSSLAGRHTGRYTATGRFYLQPQLQFSVKGHAEYYDFKYDPTVSKTNLKDTPHFWSYLLMYV